MPPPEDAQDHAKSATIGEPPVPLVPSRRQYLDLKAQHPNALLLYRMGDFYEAFDDDAQTLARDARVTLTSRNFGRNGRTPMAGVPYHALNTYLGRLLAAGHTVAIAEQMTAAGKGLVEREITRVLSPGAVDDAALLPDAENRFLAAIVSRGDRAGLSWVDVSTGEWWVTEWSGDQVNAAIAEELARLNPAECLLPDDQDEQTWARAATGHVTRIEAWLAGPERAVAALCRQFGTTSLEPFGCAGMPAAAGAAALILAYLERTHPLLLNTLTGLRTLLPDRRVGLDAITRRNLELTRAMRSGGARGSLLGVLDVTRTRMGARSLRRTLGDPLRDLDQLRQRQVLVAGLVERPAARVALANALTHAGDLERLAGRIARGGAAPRDLLALATAVRAVPAVMEVLAPLGEAAAFLPLDPCPETLALLERAVEADPDGVRIRDGFSPDLDAAIAGTVETRRWLAALETRERERTGIKSLKVGYTRVFGYYLEITRPNLPLVPAEYIRKQTIANGERFFTGPLKDAEARLLAADDEIAGHEREAIATVCRAVAKDIARLLATAGTLALLDAILALAEIAARYGWVAPELTLGDDLEIVGGRHPVVEALAGGDAFIPNDCALGGDAPCQLIITGPNMGGKSTYLRQTGLIVLLAQIGSFVPAVSARIGLVDRIYTRAGAADDLARGQSTFMVEMTETAAILHGATRQSLLLLDEVGRGTSTRDGLAIARAALEDISRRIGARCLFATHYLELTALAEELPDVANVHVAALERGAEIVFLYAVRPGPAGSAYGVQVARLAGLPPWVAARAEAFLAESIAAEPVTAPNGAALLREQGERYDAEPEPEPDPNADVRGHGHGHDHWLAEALRALDLDGLTPRQALEWLWETRARLDQDAH